MKSQTRFYQCVARSTSDCHGGHFGYKLRQSKMADDKSDDEFESNNEGQLLAEDVLQVVDDGNEFENTGEGCV